MKLYLILLILPFIMIGRIGVCNTLAQDSTDVNSSELQFSISTDFSNKYLWRGMCYNRGLVFQPEAAISFGGLSFSVWSNLSIWDVDDAKGNEIDFTLDFSHSFSNLDVETYLSYYKYIDQEGVPNTAEWFVGASCPLGNFSISAGLNIDIIGNAGASYLELGLNYEHELSSLITVSGSLTTGFASKKFNSYYLEVEKSAFNIAGMNIGLSYSPFTNFYIEPHFLFNYTIDRDLVSSLLGSHSSYFGINFRKEF